jgi:uncharacterized protein
MWRAVTVPVFGSLVFVYAVVAVLGWWRPVFTDEAGIHRRQAGPALGVDPPSHHRHHRLRRDELRGLGPQGHRLHGPARADHAGAGFAEEGMFRGLGVAAFRVNGFTEAKVALWTCVLFGLAHATNLFEGQGFCSPWPTSSW